MDCLELLKNESWTNREKYPISPVGKQPFRKWTFRKTADNMESRIYRGVRQGLRIKDAGIRDVGFQTVQMKPVQGVIWGRLLS